jgi:GGDEF domain-containing protein
LALAGAALATAALPSLGGFLGIGLATAGPRGLLAAGRLPAAAALGCALAAGALRDASLRSALRLLSRVRDLARRNVKLKKMNAALSTLSDELERRVSGQRDSVSALYARIRKMDSNDMDTVMSGLLEAVQAFSQASSAAVYEYDPATRSLVRLASLGPEAEAFLPMDGSVPGWVFRNDSTFSLRNVDDYLNLAYADCKNSILAYPVKAGDLPWGVLNVSEMPFYRYNPVTERNLEIVVELASSYIKNAADFRDRAMRHSLNEITGLPSFEELRRMLGDELERRAKRRLSVSLVIVELLGFKELVFERSGHKVFALLKEFADRAVADAGGRAFAFHFREDGQLAFFLPDIDRGGASLFCIGLIEKAGAWRWQIDGESACVEIAFGLASYPDAAGVEAGAALEGKPEALIAEAEAVLARSKGAYVEHGGRC